MKYWQKCPICDGTGKVYNNLMYSNFAFPSEICPTCRGLRMIETPDNPPPVWEGPRWVYWWYPPLYWWYPPLYNSRTGNTPITVPITATFYPPQGNGTSGATTY